MNDSIKIVQISDIHLYADISRALLGVKTEDSFQAVIDMLHQQSPKPDLVILSGDLSQDFSEAAYRRVAEKLKPFSIPVYCIPGNHDDPKLMTRVYPLETITADKHIVRNHWQIILLDSHKPGAVEGYLKQEQLDFMEACLKKYPEHHAMVVFHHQPFPVGCAWLDNIGLKNADELWKIIVQYPRAQTVLFGHVHQEHHKLFNGVQCYSTPSTCIQFKTNSAQFALEKLHPGYRWLELFADGTIQTKVHRTKQYVGIFDVDAKGY